MAEWAGRYQLKEGITGKVVATGVPSSLPQPYRGDHQHLLAKAGGARDGA
jgi:hypothetical protein